MPEGIDDEMFLGEGDWCGRKRHKTDMGKDTREYTTDEERRVCERRKHGVREVNVKMQLFYSISLRHIYTHNLSYP